MNLNNFKEVKYYLNTNHTTTDLSWKENKQKASIKILNYINDYLQQYEIKNTDTANCKRNKTLNNKKLKETILYVLDKLQRSFNASQGGGLPEFKDLDDTTKNRLDENIYNELTGKSTQNEKLSKILLKNLKIIVSHKNTDGFWNDSNTRTNWFGKDKYTKRTKTHEDFIKFVEYKFNFSDSVFKNLSRVAGKNPKYMSGFRCIELPNNFAQIKGKFDKNNNPILGQIKSHDTGDSLIKNNIEFYKNPKDDKYYFKRTIKQDSNDLKIYLFKTNKFDENLDSITGTIQDLIIEDKTIMFTGKKTENGYSGKLQLGEQCIIAEFDNDFQIIQLKKIGIKSGDSETFRLIPGDSQKEIIKQNFLNNLYWFSQSTLFSSEDFQRIFNKLNAIIPINNQQIKCALSNNSVSDYMGETKNGQPDGVGIINWSDTHHTFLGKFNDGNHTKGIIIKGNKIYHIEYIYSDNSKTPAKVIEEEIDVNNVNQFQDSLDTFKHLVVTHSDFAKEYDLSIVEKKINEIILSNPIAYISEKLNYPAKIFFGKLLDIKNVNSSSENLNGNTIVLGDADGSAGRIILAAIQSGHIKFNDIEALNCLIDILNKEACCTTGDQTIFKIKKFQNNSTISSDLKKILNGIEYKSSDYKLVCIGDIIHDRFSNNKNVMMELIRHLYKKGVIFILGNHDSIEHCFTEDNQPRLGTCQVGECAVKQLSNDEAIELEKLFTRCYYDEESNKFYIHNGIKYNPNSKKYETAFGDITVEIKSIEELVREINKLENNFRTELFTDFRPDSKDMSDIQLFRDKSCIIVHGHSGEAQNSENLYSLNARDSNGEILPSAIKF